MRHVAIKGGGKAIKGAEVLLDYLRAEQGDAGLPLDLETIEHQLRFLHSRVMSEGGLYYPKPAFLAVKQSLGDTLEAAFALRAYRSTQPRVLETPILDTADMRLVRRVSAAFKDIPGGRCSGLRPTIACASCVWTYWTNRRNASTLLLGSGSPTCLT